MTEGFTRRVALGALAGVVAPAQAAPTSKAGLPSDKADGLSSYRHGPPPFIGTRRALDKLREVGASVRDTGAIGDGLADDTPALQEIADYFSRVGGEWSFPSGVFRTSAPIKLDGANPQRIGGRGKRGVYPGPFVPSARSELAVIMPVHTERSALQFTGTRAGHGSIHLHGIALAAMENGPVPTAAFAWDTKHGFLRDFTFEDCSVHGFTSAFDLFNGGGENNAMGVLRVQRCNINRNRWIARTMDDTQWNGFFFRDNEAGQNGYLPGQGGISIRAHNAVIAGNCLEGQRDPVKLWGAMRGVTVSDNYFEANVGIGNIHLQNIRGPFEIGANTFIEIDHSKLEHLVLLTNCGHGRVSGSYWGDGVHKMALPTLGNSAAADNVLSARVRSDVHGLLRMDSFDMGTTYVRQPAHLAMATRRVAVASRQIAPWNGLVMPVAEHNTTNSNSIAVDYSIDGRIGDWVAVSCLFRREPGYGPASDPYLGISVNANRAPGSRDFVAFSFDEHWRSGEWCLLTAAVRLQTVMSHVSLSLSPYGIKPSRGRRTSYLNPVVYTTGSPSDIIPYIDDYVARSVVSPPDVGGFRAGDVLMNAKAAAQQAFYVKLDGAGDHWAYS